MIELPKERIKPTMVNPSSMIIFGKPKIGKTTLMAQLPNCLILDLEGGTNFLEAVKIDIKKETEKQKIDNPKITPIKVLMDVIETIKTKNQENGGYIYQFGAIDTVTALEDMVMPIAVAMYRNTSMGKAFTGNDVLTLPNGAGYKYTRDALQFVLDKLKECFETLIILGHIKDKLIERDGKEMNERGLDLTGKSATITCAEVDAVGYMYRDENKTIINFQPSESITCGSRITRFQGKEITVIESDENGNLSFHWDKIFV